MIDFRYKNIFMYGSLQFCGNIEEYFSKNTEKLLIFIVMPRLRNKFNILRIYKKGKLRDEKKIWSSGNIFLYYLLWYLSYLYFIIKFYHKNEKFIVIASHPISFLGMSIQKLIRKITFVYFVGDYFPPVSLPLKLFEKLKKHYHDRIGYACYLSDKINKIFNDKIINTSSKKTIMWGVKDKKIKRVLPRKNVSVLFIGLVKNSEGLDLFYEFLKNHKDYSIKIIGVCENSLYKKHLNIIKDYQIEKQVYFPNRFFSDHEVDEISKNCHVAVALYDTSSLSSTYYTDPGKVKAYAELGLPIIMSNTSSVVEYVKKFNAGVIVDRSATSIANALVKIKENYSLYSEGIKKFNSFFNFDSFYKEKYKFLEEI